MCDANSMGSYGSPQSSMYPSPQMTKPMRQPMPQTGGQQMDWRIPPGQMQMPGMNPMSMGQNGQFGHNMQKRLPMGQSMPQTGGNMTVNGPQPMPPTFNGAPGNDMRIPPDQQMPPRADDPNMAPSQPPTYQGMPQMQMPGMNPMSMGPGGQFGHFNPMAKPGMLPQQQQPNFMQDQQRLAQFRFQPGYGR